MKRAHVTPAAADFDAVLALLGIESLVDRMPAKLSGGEGQRFAVARALLTRPRLLLMDEPLAALDVKRKVEILPYLERLRDELEVPIVYVSHSPDEAARLADHLALMDAGQIVASGSLSQILGRGDLPSFLADDAGVVLNAIVAERVPDEPRLARSRHSTPALHNSHTRSCSFIVSMKSIDLIVCIATFCILW